MSYRPGARRGKDERHMGEGKHSMDGWLLASCCCPILSLSGLLACLFACLEESFYSLDFVHLSSLFSLICFSCLLCLHNSTE